MSMIPDGAVDMILADLPYGVTECQWDRLLPFDQLWKQFERIVKPNGAVVLTSCQPFTTALIQSNLKRFRYCWYWHKNRSTGFCFSKYQPMRCIEDVVVFYRKAPTYNPQGLIATPNPVKRKRRANADSVYRIDSYSTEYTSKFSGYPNNLLAFKCELGLHPTQKPVALFSYLIQTYTNPGELVVDCCIGSGTTAVACIQTGRNYLGFELDKTHYETATARIKEAKQDAGRGTE